MMQKPSFMTSVWPLWKRWFAAKLASGFSLVELMTAMAITSLLAIGIFTLIDYVQRTNVKVINTANISGKIDEAELAIRSKIGPADRLLFDNDSVIDATGVGSVECLLVQRRSTRDRTGLTLADEDDYIAATGYKGIGGKQNFSLSFWFKRNNMNPDNESIVTWGDYNASGLSSISAHLLDSGRLRFNFGTEDAVAPIPDNLNDDRWHHVLLSYDNSSTNGWLAPATMQLYVDGIPRILNFSTGGIQLNIDADSSGDDFTVGIGNTGETISDFNGAVSDVRLFSSPTTVTNATQIINKANDLLGVTKEIHWPLDSISTTTLTDSSTNGRNGTLNDSDIEDPIFTTTEESFVGDVFAMVDTFDDGNDHYILMHSDTRNECPSNGTDTNGFTAVTADIFLRDPNVGFFTQSDNLSTNILFNYGYGQSDIDRVAVNSRAQTRKLATTQKFTNLDLCRAAPSMTFTAPSGGTCNVNQAFAYIADDYDNATDELFIPNAQYWADNTTYHSIAFGTDKIIAKWSSETGVMRFYTTDGTDVDLSIWEEVLSQIAYRPTSQNYIATKRLIVSIGYLPMPINGEYHFYEFMEANEGDTVSWTTSQTNAYNAMFCGTRGYLATVTSKEENDFLIERFRKSTGSVPAGWLGGSDVATPGDWVWEANSPEAGLQFWHQTSDTSAAGRPVQADGSAVADGDYTLQDNVREPGTSPTSFERRVTKSTNPAVTLAYHNWASTEPNDVGSSGGNGEPYLQIVGSSAGNGYWNDLPDTRDCEDDEKYQPCGYYVEWGGRTGESLNSVVFELTVDLSKQREFCEPKH